MGPRIGILALSFLALDSVGCLSIAAATEANQSQPNGKAKETHAWPDSCAYAQADTGSRPDEAGGNRAGRGGANGGADSMKAKSKAAVETQIVAVEQIIKEQAARLEELVQLVFGLPAQALMILSWIQGCMDTIMMHTWIQWGMDILMMLANSVLPSLFISVLYLLHAWARSIRTHRAPASINQNWRLCREVWEWNLDLEFSAFVSAVSAAGGSSAVLAIDFEFPGKLINAPRGAWDKEAFAALIQNVLLTKPIQFGVAVSNNDGTGYGVWNFNFQFDSSLDRHFGNSLEYLRNHGVDFPRHRNEGIDANDFGQRLANSGLFSPQGNPRLITFSGEYDVGYLLKLLTSGHLPSQLDGYQQALQHFCPNHVDLRLWLGNRGSLDDHRQRHGVQRQGLAHNGGSDALVTLEIFWRLLVRSRSPVGSADGWPRSSF